MKRPTLETVNASLSRWHTRLRRAANAIKKLEAQKKRLEKAKPVLMIAKPEPLALTIMREITAPEPAPVAPATDISIPAFLQRKPLDATAQAIKDEQAEVKRRKAAGRIATMKAKKSGETRKMPLTGRAALEAIRNG